MTTYTGKCHCGQQEWTVQLQPDQQSHVLCHCNTCKILSGGGYTMGQVIPKTHLKFTKGGELKEYVYKGDSGNSVHCYYCPNCTTHVFHNQEVMGPDMIIARTGLFAEGRESFGVTAEIYGKDRMAWQKEVAVTFPVLPPQ